MSRLTRLLMRVVIGAAVVVAAYSGNAAQQYRGDQVPDMGTSSPGPTDPNAPNA